METLSFDKLRKSVTENKTPEEISEIENRLKNFIYSKNNINNDFEWLKNFKNNSKTKKLF